MTIEASPQPVQAGRDRPRRFGHAIVLIALGYAVLQNLYIVRLPLVMDEFAGEMEAWDVLHALPYRDYIPYKTVLGYYLEAIPLLLNDRLWDRLITIKASIVLVNTALLAAAAWMLGRTYRWTAVVLALGLMVSCSTFLERSSELRVDMLTAWAGLASLLALIRTRPGWAGIFCGLSFLISQKGALYVAAADAALVVCWLVVERTSAQFRRIVIFNASAAAVVALYVAFWGSLSSFRTVFRTVFFAAAGAAGTSGYQIRFYWLQILRRDPVFFVVAGAGALALMYAGVRGRRSGPLMIGVYGAVILFLGAIYPQPWPYFFVLLFPTMFVVAAAWFDQLGDRQWAPSFRRALVLIVVAGGVLYPLTRVPVVLARDQSYQRYNVELAARLLEPSDTYLAGMSMIQEHEQYPERLVWLGAPQLNRLRNEPPESLAQLLAQLRRRPPKLLIVNYRILGLPGPIHAYLSWTYTRLSGSVYLYGPAVRTGRTTVNLAFSGPYLIDAPKPCTVRIDGAGHASGTRVPLARGEHTIETPEPLRLRFLPAGIEHALDPRFQREEPLFPAVYTY